MTDEESKEFSFLRELLSRLKVENAGLQVEVEMLKDQLLNTEAKETIKEMNNHDIQKH